MRHLKKLCAVLLAVLLLCGCTATHGVSSEKEAEEALLEYLGDFVSFDAEDYDCTLQGTLSEEGQTVYIYEAFWSTDDGEHHSLGLFRVTPDGTVAPEPAATPAS